MSDSIATGAFELPDDQPRSSDFVFGDHCVPCRCLPCRYRAMEILLTFGIKERNRRFGERLKRDRPGITERQMDEAIHRRVGAELKVFRWN